MDEKQKQIKKCEYYKRRLEEIKEVKEEVELEIEEIEKKISVLDKIIDEYSEHKGVISHLKRQRLNHKLDITSCQRTLDELNYDGEYAKKELEDCPKST